MCSQGWEPLFLPILGFISPQVFPNKFQETSSAKFCQQVFQSEVINLILVHMFSLWKHVHFLRFSNVGSWRNTHLKLLVEQKNLSHPAPGLQTASSPSKHDSLSYFSHLLGMTNPRISSCNHLFGHLTMGCFFLNLSCSSLKPVMCKVEAFLYLALKSIHGRPGSGLLW